MKKNFYCTLLALISTISIQAQVNYTFDRATSTYTNITGGTTPTLLATTSGGNTDEGYANTLPIGFTFNYNGTNYTTIGVCTNGFAYFGTTGLTNSSVTYSNNLPTAFTSGIRPLIAPFWDDLDIQSTTNLRYITTGIAPNRVFKIEWANVLWDYSGTDAALSFQLLLYETTNVIEFIYKQEVGLISNAGGTFGASIGLSATGTGNGNFICLNNSTNTATISTSVNTTDIQTKPATGQVYRFTPTASCSGTPIAGNASSSVTTTCSGANFNLSLNGYSSENGITFQWYTSIANANSWSPISGATGVAYTVSQTQARDYKCLVTCTNSSSATYSNIVTVGLTPSGSCVLSNDDCTGAITLTQTDYSALCVSGAFNTSLATQSSTASTFFVSSHDDDIWYKFVATSNSIVIRFTNINAISGSAGNIALALSSGADCNSLTEISGTTITISNGSGEALFYGLNVGTTYYVRVATSTTSWRAEGNMCILKPQISSGTTNSCLSLTVPTINATNNNIWLPIYDGTKIIGEINAQGNNLGATMASIYVSSAVRQYSSSSRYYLNRNIEITPTTQTTSNVLVRLYLLNSELNDLINQAGSQVTSLNDLIITKNNDNCNAVYSGSGTSITPTSRVSYGSNGAYLEFPVASFSSFYIHGGIGVLPVTLVNFTAAKNDNENIVKWETEKENNLKNFELEKSIDGNNFSLIAAYESLGKEKNSYVHIDKNKITSTVYYRLKMIDKDGRFKYSNILQVVGLKTQTIQIVSMYPNPAKEKITILIQSPNKQEVTYSIVDIIGKTITKKSIMLNEGENNILVTLEHLNSGNYMMKFFDREKEMVQKFIKL